MKGRFKKWAGALQQRYFQYAGIPSKALDGLELLGMVSNPLKSKGVANSLKTLFPFGSSSNSSSSGASLQFWIRIRIQDCSLMQVTHRVVEQLSTILV